MAPIIFTIGPYNAYAFGFFLAVSFLFSTFVVFKYAKNDFKEDEYTDAYLYFSISAIIFARLFYIIKNFDQFGFLILKYFVVRETPGLSLFAGSIGGVIFLYWYAQKKKLNFVRLLDIFSIAVSVAMVFTKIGEQLGGAGFGKETNSLLGVKIIGLPGRYHPVELYEALLYFFISLFLIWFYAKQRKKKWDDGFTFYLFTALSAILVFLVEFFKANNVYLYGFTVKQVIAAGILLMAVYPIFLSIRSVIALTRKIKGA